MDYYYDAHCLMPSAYPEQGLPCCSIRLQPFHQPKLPRSSIVHPVERPPKHDALERRKGKGRGRESECAGGYKVHTLQQTALRPGSAVHVHSHVDAYRCWVLHDLDLLHHRLQYEASLRPRQLSTPLQHNDHQSLALATFLGTTRLHGVHNRCQWHWLVPPLK